MGNTGTQTATPTRDASSPTTSTATVCTRDRVRVGPRLPPAWSRYRQSGVQARALLPRRCGNVDRTVQAALITAFAHCWPRVPAVEARLRADLEQGQRPFTEGNKATQAGLLVEERLGHRHSPPCNIFAVERYHHPAMELPYGSPRDSYTRLITPDS